MALELSRRYIDRVWAQEYFVIVTAVGAGLRHTPGISARIFGALGQAGHRLTVKKQRRLVGRGFGHSGPHCRQHLRGRGRLLLKTANLKPRQHFVLD